MSAGQVTHQDREWMGMALRLARLGDIGTSPNPRVGCVLVRDGECLASGWHARCGGPHAEAEALGQLSEPADARGATAYVTLEPCSHHGRTPPCCDALIAAGIARCVIGMVDPHPLVAGQGIQAMEAAGIEVHVLPMSGHGRWVNRRFLSGLERGRPWVVLKCAVSADGFVDPPRRPGETGSLAITSPALRKLTHRWRSEEDAILVGAQTVTVDNPTLNAREAGGPHPLRLILDPHGRTPSASKVYEEGEQDTWVVGGPQTLPEWIRRMEAEPHDDAFMVAMGALHEAELRSVLVEGGARTLERVLASGCWDELRICTSASNTGGGLSAPDWPGQDQALLRGSHPFGSDRVDYWVRNESAQWVGDAPAPTLSIAMP